MKKLILLLVPAILTLLSLSACASKVNSPAQKEVTGEQSKSTAVITVEPPHSDK